MLFRFILLSILLSSKCLIITSARSIIVDNIIPNCKQHTQIESKSINEDATTGNRQIFSSVQLQMILDDSACIEVKSVSNETTTIGRRLHVLKFSRLELNYPITARYSFGIPLITTNCICDCAGGENHCNSIAYKYRNCSSSSIDTNSLCYRVHHASQSPIGCTLTTSESEVCCQIHIEPYNNGIYWALQLSQYDTNAIFQYQLFEMRNDRWKLIADDYIQVALNSGKSHLELNNNIDIDRLSIAIAGTKPHRQLKTGMYFVANNEHRLKHQVLINEPLESNLNQLGWLRQQQNGAQWNIYKGHVKLTEAQHVLVEDCKAQKYSVTYNAEQLVLADSKGNVHNDTVNYGTYVDDLKWIRSVNVINPSTDRHITISHGEGTLLIVTITMEQSQPYSILHHSSHLSTFNGSINVDKQSNRYLNLTFAIGTRGTLIGNIYTTDDRRRADIVFSTYISSSDTNQSTNIIIGIPSNVNSSRFVCFHPSGSIDCCEQCHWLPYYAEQLQWYLVANSWQTNIGDCIGCNEIGIDNFVQYLNPKQWLNGFNSTSETIAFAFEITVNLLVLIVIFILVRKCIWPMIRWILCTSPSPKK